MSVHSFIQSRVLEPLRAFLKQGVAPRELALSVALGIVIGNIPILGVSTVLCALIALVFRLNLPAIQLAQAAMAPTQLLLIIPFVRLGERITRAPAQPLSVRASIASFASFATGAGHAAAALRDAMLHAGIAWLLVAPAAVLILYAFLAPACARAAGGGAARGKSSL